MQNVCWQSGLLAGPGIGLSRALSLRLLFHKNWSLVRTPKKWETTIAVKIGWKDAWVHSLTVQTKWVEHSRTQVIYERARSTPMKEIRLSSKDSIYHSDLD